MWNRNGLLVDACLTRADGPAERIVALHMIEPLAMNASFSIQPVKPTRAIRDSAAVNLSSGPKRRETNP